MRHIMEMNHQSVIIAVRYFYLATAKGVRSYRQRAWYFSDVFAAPKHGGTRSAS